MSNKIIEPTCTATTFVVSLLFMTEALCIHMYYIEFIRCMKPIIIHLYSLLYMYILPTSQVYNTCIITGLINTELIQETVLFFRDVSSYNYTKFLPLQKRSYLPLLQFLTLYSVSAATTSFCSYNKFQPLYSVSADTSFSHYAKLVSCARQISHHDMTVISNRTTGI